MTKKQIMTETGFGLYVGTKRVGWSLDLDGAVDAAKEAVRKYPTKNRFVPAVTVYDQAQLLVVGMVTDDANGIQFHHRNAAFHTH